MDHLEAIVVLKNIINPKFIEKIIPLIDEKSKEKLEVRKGVDEDVRNVKGYGLSLNSPTNIFYWNFIKSEIEKIYSHYRIKFPRMRSNKINQIDLLKYSKGGKYEIHTDSYSTSPRSLSVIMNLNNTYKGGDLIFSDQKNNEIKRLKLGKGSIVFFPSNFMYPHMIEPITKGTRYSIVAWLQ
jgi:deoxyribodipyrimidine photolyase-like uncharacterized protein